LVPSLYTPTCASVLSSHIDSLLDSFESAVATIICYAPRVVTTRFALSGEISLIRTDHVSSEEPACNARAGSVTPALPLTKLVSPVRCISLRWLVSFNV